MEDLAAVKGKSKSPSSRRAWIEIRGVMRSIRASVVALLAEGVDRNLLDGPETLLRHSRPPRGGRG